MTKQVSKALIKSDAVAAALRHTENIAAPEGKDALTELKKRRTQLARLTDLQGSLLGVEQVARDRVQTERDKLRKRVGELEAVVLPAVSSYKVFDLEPLSWRDGDGLPRLVPFHVEQSLFHISTEMHTDGTVKNHYVPQGLHKLLGQCYADVERKISKLARAKTETVTLEVLFTGVIPDDVRAKIAEVRTLFGKEIYIVAEAEQAALTYREPTTKPKPAPRRSIRNGDPLVIGFDGRQFRLIAAFDLTPVEQLVRDRVNGVRAS